MLVLLTCSDGRPEAFGMLIGHLEAQEYGGSVVWIASGREMSGYPLDRAGAMCDGRSWEFRRLVPDDRPGVAAMVVNLRAAMDVAEEEYEADRVLFVEDDDLYGPGYLAAYDAALGESEMVGAPNARYYNVRARRWRRLSNDRHASLAQTGLAGPAIAHARTILEVTPTPLQYDRHVWYRWEGRKRLDPGLSPLHVSIKGMPGVLGYGIGHRDTFGTPDEGLRVFREWGLPEGYLKHGEG